MNDGRSAFEAWTMDEEEATSAVAHRVMRLSARMLICGFFCLAPDVAHGAPKHVLHVMVEDAAPPWSKADGTGFANEVVAAAFTEAGVAISMDVVPYARCKHAVLGGTVAACVSMTWIPEFEGKVVLASEPLIMLNVDVFENVDRPLPRAADGRCSLPPGTRTGVVRKYEYPPEVEPLVGKGVITETNSDHQSIKMLAAGRLDAAIVLTNDLESREQKVVDVKAQQKVRWAFGCGHETGTIGFSLKHPQGPAARAAYEAGYKRIRENGKLEQITARWRSMGASASK